MNEDAEDEDFETEEESALIDVVDSQIDQGLPRNIDDLARSVGKSRFDPVFRIALWRSMERVRETTGTQLVIRRGVICETSPKEQLHEAEKRLVTAANRLRRGYEIGALALVRDPGLSAAYERQLERQARRSSAEDSAIQAEVEDRRRAAALRGEKT